MAIKEDSLREALRISRCPELPKQLATNDERFWIEAIVLVKKQNCTTSYALAKHKGDSSIVITHDFGLMSPVAGIASIHPYLYLDDNFIPKSEGNSLKNLLITFYGKEKEERINNATEEELEFMRLEYAIANQAANSSTLALQETIEETAQRIKEKMDAEADIEPPILSAPTTKKPKK